MDWLKPILDLASKLKLLWAYLAGYFTGKKVQKLQMDKKRLEAKEKLRIIRDEILKKKIVRNNELVNEWQDILKTLDDNPAHQSSVMQKDPK